MTLFEPTPHVASSTEVEIPVTVGDARKTMIDLQFTTHDRIADLLTSQHAETLSAMHAAVERFLEMEQHLVLDDPGVLTSLGVERATILFGQSSIRHALNRVVWSDAGTFALARSIEDLRLKFLDHAEIYSGPSNRQTPLAS